MVRVNDSLPPMLTPQEIEEWRKEKALKQEINDIQAQLAEAQTKWMEHKGKPNEKEYVDKFNKISMKLELKRAELFNQ